MPPDTLPSDTLVTIENLSRFYGTYCAVDSLNFTLQRGEVLGFLGPNGAGKSTTMKMLAGVLAPSAGRICINGIDLLDEPQAAKRHIGYLPEQPPLYPDLTVNEFLDYCARLNRVAAKVRLSARENAKARCGLADTGKRLLGNLSKGFQQRVGIAQAIIHKPDVVILDEPTVGLDPLQIREIRTLITELGQAHSVILSTHILPEVQAICSNVQVIHQGRLVFADSMANLDAQLTGTDLILGAQHLPPDSELAAIPGVQSITRLDSRRVRISHAQEAALAQTLARRAVEQNWGLLELTPERQTLEQVFMKLTVTDNKPEVASTGIQEPAA